jgi:hypothetical protein
MPARRLSCAAAATLLSLTGAWLAPAIAQGATDTVPAPAAPTPADGAAHWQALLRADLAFVTRTLETRYIYAVYPGGAAWREVFEPARQRAEDAVATIKDFAGYRAVLSRYVSSFRDPHLRLVAAIQPARHQWPSYIARYAAGRYEVAVSRLPTVPVGAEITACDGRPLHAWVDVLADLEVEIPGTEATRTALAPRVFVDAGNPFYARPVRCTIGGVETTLEWSSTAADRWAALAGPRADFADVPTGLGAFGARGAWIRMPAMSPRTLAEADAYRAVIAQAPALRDRDVIVFDVRGNGGGAYNWFAAILHALYGRDYASYHARERLRIQPVFVAGTIDGPPTGPAKAEAKPSAARPADPFGTPEDEDLTRVITDIRQVRMPEGGEVTVLGAARESLRTRRAGRPPPNPVRARVLVLTDPGCASACLSFVDEMRQFPGVLQVGLDTTVDRRSGSSLPYPLPGGTATLLVPSMVREHRARGENVPWVPTARFAGDIADTAAVQRWLRQDVLPAPTPATPQ